MENTTQPNKFIIAVEELEALFQCILEARHKHGFPEDIRNFLNTVKSKIVPYQEKVSSDGTAD